MVMRDENTTLKFHKFPHTSLRGCHYLMIGSGLLIILTRGHESVSVPSKNNGGN